MSRSDLPILEPEISSSHLAASIPTDFPEKKSRKPLLNRRRDDRSQSIRSGLQIGFLLLNVWIGFQFYLWVRYYETGGHGWHVPRPPGVEGWLPIASLMNLKAWVMTGAVPPIHAAGMFLLVAFLVISLIFRKAFCGWLCPVGTVSETLWQFGRKLMGRNFRLPAVLDYPLRALKYLLLALFLYAVGSMSAPAIRNFLDGPYGVVADVKMLGFFRNLSLFVLAVVGLLVVASLFVRNSWCRYLCPYGALMGLFSLLSPLKIRRDEDLCIDCARCARACPSGLPVDRKDSVQSPECVGCYQCVAACPAAGALEMKAPGGRIVRPAWIAAGILAVFLGSVLVARLGGHWKTQLPESTYFELVPNADQFSHP